MTSLHDKARRATAERFDREAGRFITPPARDADPEIMWNYRLLIAQMPGERKVLDLGCGTGMRIPIFEAAGIGGYTGIDFSEGMLARAKESFPDHRFICGDLMDITTLVDDKYDGWFAINLFLSFPLGMLRRFVPCLHKTLNPGARGRLSTFVSKQMKVTKQKDGSIVVGWAPKPLIDAFTRDGLFELVGEIGLDPDQNSPAIEMTFRAL